MAKRILLFTFFFVLAAKTLFAAPLTVEQVKTAAQSFISKRYPATAGMPARSFSPHGKSRLSVSEINSLKSSVSGKTIAFIVELEPSGFTVLRSDDLLPVLKLYSDTGQYFDLPPDFLEVMEWELSTELEILDSEVQKDSNLSTIYKKEWDAFLSSPAAIQNLGEPEPEADFEEIGPLLSTTWNQDSPYNYYAPAASGGPGGRAYAGCLACTMAQILRYHKYPAAISADYTYTDSSGSCQGTHSASDAGLGDYQWDNMPLNLSGSTTPEQQAVGQLMYHCGVTVDMNFEGSASGAYSPDVPPALRNYFNCSSDSVANRSYFSDSGWYNKINNSLDLQRPAYYAFQSTGGGGHAVVCDGSRNGDEIHLNFGWGGHNNAWYDMNYIPDGSHQWVNHEAVFNIAPKRVELAYGKYTVENDTNSDGHISPGETVDINIQLINTGGLDAYNTTAALASASVYVTVNPPSEVSYGTIYEGESAIGNSPYSLEIATNCPAENQELQLFMFNEEKIWTNTFNLLVEHLPVISVNPTNLVFEVAGISNVSDSIIVSNSGISDLIVNLFDDISSGSTNYSWTDSNSSNGPPYFWRDISSIGTLVTLGDNEKTPMVPFGFGFPFLGNTFSEFVIGANGGIGLNDVNIYKTNKQLPCGSTYAPPQFIAPFWDDLDPSSGGFMYYYAEANQLIVSWIDVPLKGTNTTETFQAILRKSGEIIFQYKNMNGNLNSATIGIQGGPQTGFNPPEKYIRIAYNSPFVTNDLAVSIRPAVENSWLEYTPKEAIISPEESNLFYFTCNSGNLTGGLYNAEVTLMHNDPTVDSIEISIDFMVFKPCALVKGNGWNILNGENEPSTFDNTDFGEVNIGIETVTNLFTVENPGTSNLNINTVSITSGSSLFYISESPAQLILPGSSSVFKLTFAPEEIGLFTGQVQFSNSDYFNNPYTFLVIGEGVPEPNLFWILDFGFWIFFLFIKKHII